MILAIAAAAFSASALILIYIYAGYPVCLWVAARRRSACPPTDLDNAALPTVSLVVAANNEELVLEAKIQNSLDLDYPPEKLQLLFVSDGSSDATGRILEAHRGKLHAMILRERHGKTGALARVLPLATGEILVFSDANVYYRSDSLRKLVRHFRDREVGVVTGLVRLLSSNCLFGTGEGAYYRYERMLQRWESRLWATVAIDGAMYAVARRLVRLPETSLVPDDLVTGMNVACQGYRVIYDPEAVAEEDSTPSDAIEFRRKVRIVGSSFQAFLRGEGVPGLSQGRLLWVYVSHKLLRWLAPLFLASAWLSAAVMTAAGNALGAWALALQTAFYLLAALAWRMPRLQTGMIRIPYYFTMVNLAAMVGLMRALAMKQGSWTRTERTLPSIR